jgi:hypothetical protein
MQAIRRQGAPAPTSPELSGSYLSNARNANRKRHILRELTYRPTVLTTAKNYAKSEIRSTAA